MHVTQFLRQISSNTLIKTDIVERVTAALAFDTTPLPPIVDDIAPPAVPQVARINADGSQSISALASINSAALPKAAPLAVAKRALVGIDYAALLRLLLDVVPASVLLERGFLNAMPNVVVTWPPTADDLLKRLERTFARADLIASRLPHRLFLAVSQPLSTRLQTPSSSGFSLSIVCCFVLNAFCCFFV